MDGDRHSLQQLIRSLAQLKTSHKTLCRPLRGRCRVLQALSSILLTYLSRLNVVSGFIASFAGQWSYYKDKYSMVYAPLKKQSFSTSDTFDISEFGPISLVVIQGTSLCNLNCDYCYLPDRQTKKSISLDLIEPIFERVFTSPFLKKDFTICWHAGEPLTMPVEFYEEAAQRISTVHQEKGSKEFNFSFSVQTNGTLINQGWCDFFNRHHFKVGVSIDGPEFLHNAHRKTWKGDGTFANVMRGISLLQKNNIQFQTISVLTEDALSYPDEIFQFFVENKIHRVGFNVEEIEGVHDDTSLSRQTSEEKFSAFMRRLWQLNREANGVLRVREFEKICQLMFTGQKLTKSDLCTPFSIISIDHLGNFSTFSPELLAMQDDHYGNFILGNVLTDSFESACKTDKFRQVYGDIRAGRQLCQDTCQYFSVCAGGAPSNKYWENHSFNSSETQSCRLYKQIITNIVLEEMESSLGLR